MFDNAKLLLRCLQFIDIFKLMLADVTISINFSIFQIKKALTQTWQYVQTLNRKPALSHTKTEY